MRLAICAGIVILLVAGSLPVMAEDFSMNGTEFAAAFISNTISNLDLGSKALKMFYAVNTTDTSSNLFQNLWGLIYGGVLVAGWNNQVTALVLDELANTSNTNLDSARTNISTAIRYIATNTTTVFGDTEGSAGLSALLKYQVKALENRSVEYNGEPLIQAYAKAIADTIHDNILFMMELFKAIPEALS
ncbi:hypothetical protein [Archaeoglobus neptunius]|uniref:hypothetical protein n=1 Tax=Archaeoglobus neptunius TaxID=2798580 RepID=UPI001928660B|nr:hypothetical protein [Archaeoglobus neptunius]